MIPEGGSGRVWGGKSGRVRSEGRVVNLDTRRVRLRVRRRLASPNSGAIADYKRTFTSILQLINIQISFSFTTKGGGSVGACEWEGKLVRVPPPYLALSWVGRPCAHTSHAANNLQMYTNRWSTNQDIQQLWSHTAANKQKSI